jgi:hypothetical protein
VHIYDIKKVRERKKEREREKFISLADLSFTLEKPILEAMKGGGGG